MSKLNTGSFDDAEFQLLTTDSMEGHCYCPFYVAGFPQDHRLPPLNVAGFPQDHPPPIIPHHSHAKAYSRIALVPELIVLKNHYRRLFAAGFLPQSGT